jgi:hypothetical protein
MSSSPNTHQIEQRVRTATYRDGLTELFAAAVLLVMALFWISTPAFVGIAAAFIVLYGWKLVEKVKQRITYPRLGYFQEQSEEPGETARGILVFCGVALALVMALIAVSGGITDAAEWRRAAPLLSGLTLAGAFWYLGDRSGLIRHRVVAMYSVATGFVIWLFTSGADYEGMVWHLLGMVLVLGGLGTWELIHFIRTHPVRDEVTDA